MSSFISSDYLAKKKYISASRFYNWKIQWPYVLLECESIWNVVPLWPDRSGREKQILSPLSSFVANGSLSFAAFVVENLPGGRLRCLFGIYAITRPLVAVTRSPDVRSCRLSSRSHGFSQIQNSAGEEGGEEAVRVLAYNASIKAKRRVYVQRTYVAVLRELCIKGTIKNISRQVERIRVYVGQMTNLISLYRPVFYLFSSRKTLYAMIMLIKKL